MKKLSLFLLTMLTACGMKENNQSVVPVEKAKTDTVTVIDFSKDMVFIVTNNKIIDEKSCGCVMAMDQDNLKEKMELNMLAAQAEDLHEKNTKLRSFGIPVFYRRNN